MAVVMGGDNSGDIQAARLATGIRQSRYSIYSGCIQCWWGKLFHPFHLPTSNLPCRPTQIVTGRGRRGPQSNATVSLLVDYADSRWVDTKSNVYPTLLPCDPAYIILSARCRERHGWRSDPLGEACPSCLLHTVLFRDVGGLLVSTYIRTYLLTSVTIY